MDILQGIAVEQLEINKRQERKMGRIEKKMDSVLSVLEEIRFLGLKTHPGLSTPSERKKVAESEPMSAEHGTPASPAVSTDLAPVRSLAQTLALGQRRASAPSFANAIKMMVKDFVLEVIKQNQNPDSNNFLGTEVSKQDRGRARKVFNWLKDKALDEQKHVFLSRNCPTEGQERQ